MKQINHDDIEALCLGSTFLATGGGGDPYVAKLLTQQALKKHGSVELVSLDQLPEDALVLALGEVGAPTVSLEQLPIGSEPSEAVRRLENWLAKKATHLVSFEIGGANSVIPLVAAAECGLPLLDGDGMGRALPEAQMMTFAIEAVRPTPAVAVDYTGSATYFDTDDTLVYERQVRALAMAMGGMVFTAEHPMDSSAAKRAVVPGTISFAIKLGQLLAENRGLATDIEQPLAELFAASDYGDCRRIFSGKITDIERKTVGGFDVGEASLESFTPGEAALKIYIKNEFLVAEQSGKVLASVPDLICMVDHETSTPINSERLSYGQRVTLFAVGCPAHYQTERALAVVGPRAFGFDFDWEPSAA